MKSPARGLGGELKQPRQFSCGVGNSLRGRSGRSLLGGRFINCVLPRSVVPSHGLQGPWKEVKRKNSVSRVSCRSESPGARPQRVAQSRRPASSARPGCQYSRRTAPAAFPARSGPVRVMQHSEAFYVCDWVAPASRPRSMHETKFRPPSRTPAPLRCVRHVVVGFSSLRALVSANAVESRVWNGS